MEHEQLRLFEAYRAYFEIVGPHSVQIVATHIKIAQLNGTLPRTHSPLPLKTIKKMAKASVRQTKEDAPKRLARQVAATVGLAGVVPSIIALAMKCWAFLERNT